MAIVDGHIRCSRCRLTKPVSEFQPSVARAGCGACRNCKYLDKRAYEQANPKQAAAASARHRNTRNRDEYLAGRRTHYVENPDVYRNYNLGKYGLTVADYDALLASQGGRCACCHGTENRKGHRLFVDHDHETGAVRGLLCHKCNAGIGALGDSIDGVRRALDYLERAQRPVPRVAPTMRINLLKEAN